MKKILAALAVVTALFALVLCDAIAGGGSAPGGKPAESGPSAEELKAQKTARDAYYESMLIGIYKITNKGQMSTWRQNEVELAAFYYDPYLSKAPCGSGVWTFEEAEKKWGNHLRRILDDPEEYYDEEDIINESDGSANNIFRGYYNALKEQYKNTENSWRYAGLVINYYEQYDMIFPYLYDVGSSKVTLYNAARVDGAYYEKEIQTPPPGPNDPDPNDTDSLCGVWKHQKGGSGSITLKSDGSWAQGRYADRGVEMINRTWTKSGNTVTIKGTANATASPKIETEFTLSGNTLVFVSEKITVNNNTTTNTAESYILKNTFGQECSNGSLVKQQ